MKKTLLTIATIIGLTMTFNAQSINGTLLKEIDVEYLQIVGTAKFLSSKITVQIDFGQNQKLIQSAKKTAILDENGKKLIFNSMIDALNFFSKYDYEFVTAYVVTIGKQNVYHYLLRNNNN
jgi:hypothetical protein